MSIINKGDFVKIVDNGKCYTTHITFARNHNLNKFKYDHTAENGTKGKVVINVYGICHVACANIDIIINERGLEKINEIK